MRNVDVSPQAAESPKKTDTVWGGPSPDKAENPRRVTIAQLKESYVCMRTRSKAGGCSRTGGHCHIVTRSHGDTSRPCRANNHSFGFLCVHMPVVPVNRYNQSIDDLLGFEDGFEGTGDFQPTQEVGAGLTPASKWRRAGDAIQARTAACPPPTPPPPPLLLLPPRLCCKHVA